MSMKVAWLTDAGIITSTAEDLVAIEVVAAGAGPSTEFRPARPRRAV